MPISVADRELVENFWQEYVDGFIFNDLNNCVRAGANYLVALGEMCYIDFMGKLMTGKSRNSTDNFKKFVRSYLPQYSKPAFLDKLYGEFRSGLVHSYFPEKIDVVAVMKATPGGPSIWQDAGRWKIVVGDFVPEFKAATDAFKTDLLNGKHLTNFKMVVSTDPGLANIHTWPIGGSSAHVTSTTVTVVSSSMASLPPSTLFNPPDP